MEIMIQATPSTNYKVVRNRQSFGPFTASQLCHFALANRLMPDDLVCRMGSTSKSRVRKIECLWNLLKPNFEFERKDNGVEQNALTKDSTALRTAILSYGQWKACRPELSQSVLNAMS